MFSSLSVDEPGAIGGLGVFHSQRRVRKMKMSLKVLRVGATMLLFSAWAGAAEVSAYYTKIDSGEAFERYSRTGPYADVVVEAGDGKLVFWRGASYLPYWEIQGHRTYVDEVYPRSGDGSATMPDKVNTFSRVAIIESEADGAVIHWRYLAEFGAGNPKTIDVADFVDEYFSVTADGHVTRTIRRGADAVDQWRDPLNRVVQQFDLSRAGITNFRQEAAGSSGPARRAQGNPVVDSGVADPVSHWRFDEGMGAATTESHGNVTSEVAGHKVYWKKGVSGTALMFDGYKTVVSMAASKAPRPSDGLTLEGWVALGAYPWSWTPIVQQSSDDPEELVSMEGNRALLTGEEGPEDEEEEGGADFTFVLKKENDTGYFLGIDGLGHPALKVRVGETWEELVSEQVLERNRWYHVVGTYSKRSGTMALYVDGERTVKKKVGTEPIVLSSNAVQIGKGKSRRPITPVRANTFSESYSLDGLIDEVKIYDEALSARQVSQAYEALRPAQETIDAPDMQVRSLPQFDVANEFKGHYTQLEFYESWDDMQRVGEHPDVVVTFDDNDSKFVFWRGTGFIPMLVTENGKWYSNEFNETWNRSGGQGCQEPMSDKEAFTNHVRIIENTEARVVVHWRFPLLDVLRVAANFDDDTGWADWSDWYYYIYPDGVAAKQMHLWTHGERDHEWQESMAIFGPNQHPEQIIETTDTLQMVNLDGRVVQYNWDGGPPRHVDQPEDKVIQLINYKADYDPFTIGDILESDVYNGEVTDYAVFPTWNHWPVAQMPSDGRYASFPDRTAHSSLTHIPPRIYAGEEEGDTPWEERLLLEGLTNKPAGDLVPLARSWMRPAALDVTSGGSSNGYDPTQRAYALTAKGGALSLELDASDDHPVVNPAFVITGWGDGDATLKINGEAVPRGDDFRFGHPRTTKDDELVVWIRHEATSPLTITLSMDNN
jgi:hypothetical protein